MAVDEVKRALGERGPARRTAVGRWRAGFQPAYGEEHYPYADSYAGLARFGHGGL